MSTPEVKEMNEAWLGHMEIIMMMFSSGHAQYAYGHIRGLMEAARDDPSMVEASLSWGKPASEVFMELYDMKLEDFFPPPLAEKIKNGEGA